MYNNLRHMGSLPLCNSINYHVLFLIIDLYSSSIAFLHASCSLGSLNLMGSMTSSKGSSPPLVGLSLLVMTISLDTSSSFCFSLLYVFSSTLLSSTLWSMCYLSYFISLFPSSSYLYALTLNNILQKYVWYI